MNGKRYEKELALNMRSFFLRSIEQGELPSFSKFAKSIDVTLERLESYRGKKAFDISWRDCIEIRRDYLTDCALTRRYDPSFVKFLLGFEMGTEAETDEDNSLAVTVKVENN